MIIQRNGANLFELFYLYLLGHEVVSLFDQSGPQTENLGLVQFMTGISGVGSPKALHEVFEGDVITCHQETSGTIHLSVPFPKIRAFLSCFFSLLFSLTSLPPFLPSSRPSSLPSFLKTQDHPARLVGPRRTKQITQTRPPTKHSIVAISAPHPPTPIPFLTKGTRRSLETRT